MAQNFTRRKQQPLQLPNLPDIRLHFVKHRGAELHHILMGESRIERDAQEIERLAQHLLEIHQVAIDSNRRTVNRSIDRVPGQYRIGIASVQSQNCLGRVFVSFIHYCPDFYYNRNNWLGLWFLLVL